MRQVGGWMPFPALDLHCDRSGRKPRRSKGVSIGTELLSLNGLVPKQNSGGGKDKLGNITKQGDRYLRSLFTAGALAVIRHAKIHGTQHRPWLTALLAWRPTKVAAISLAKDRQYGLGHDG
jgi:transposase